MVRPTTASKPDQNALLPTTLSGHRYRSFSFRYFGPLISNITA